ncbi:TfoX/Sxy family protein [Salinivibrio socompensis]|uniref:TfoX/Sxy family protein n=1 Tax=Salinivibrio socompensis TaxID=1510206 RepID=UPI0004705588|nr:TfoX/Sxy family protein [Salinivibrio socompensis]
MKHQLKTQVTCFLNTFGEMEQRSMFGGTGFFYQDAMFALLTDKRFYLRGGGIVTEALVEKGCKKLFT